MCIAVGAWLQLTHQVTNKLSGLKIYYNVAALEALQPFCIVWNKLVHEFVLIFGI